MKMIIRYRKHKRIINKKNMKIINIGQHSIQFILIMFKRKTNNVECIFYILTCLEKLV